MEFIALDTETGGLNAAECALLSIGAVPSWDAPPFLCYILPQGRLDPRAVEVNGYSPELWAKRGAVPLKLALWEFQRWLFGVRDRRYEIAAHNAGFDLMFMMAAEARTGINLDLPKIWHCTKILMKEAQEAGLYQGPTSHHLNDLGEVSGFWKGELRFEAHDALQDARCCMHGLLWLRSLTERRVAA
jgi:DNA polymerase III epsilon subunit-like protein